MSVRITVVVENTAMGPGVLGEHGLACWIETSAGCLLFDTGQGLALEHNVRQLRLNWQRLRAIALSHGHYDHTGGLHTALRESPPVKVFAHPFSRQPRYLQAALGAARDVGMPAPARQALRESKSQWVDTIQPTPLLGSLMATGSIARVTDFEDTGGPFYLDTACQNSDPLADDQAVYFSTPQGTVVLLGCAHAGVINTLLYIRQLTHDAPIRAVIGGMHLVRASCCRLEQTIEHLRRLGVTCLAPGHCTGSAAVAALRTAFPRQVGDFCVGSRWEFD